jgi:hypothetical protein
MVRLRNYTYVLRSSYCYQLLPVATRCYPLLPVATRCSSFRMTCIIPANQPLYDILSRRLTRIKGFISDDTEKIEYFKRKENPDSWLGCIASCHDYIRYYTKMSNEFERDLISIAQCPTPITTTDNSERKYRADYPNFLTEFIPQGIAPDSMDTIRARIPLVPKPLAPKYTTPSYTKENPRRSPRLASKTKC